MEIRAWQQRWQESVSRRFPKNISTEQRLLAIGRQLADASFSLAVETGDVECNWEKQRKDIKHAIACVFIDLFVLAAEQNVDLEHEFVKAERWFKQE